jgi:Na+/proline symporter
MMVQRALSCKDLPSARKAMIGSGIFVFIQFSIFLLVGTLLNQYFQLVDLTAINPNIASDYLDSSFNVLKDRELPLLINSYLPIGIRGILLVGVLSAAMSTLSSSINSLSSSTLRDILDVEDNIKLSKAISVFWAFALIFIASVFDESNNLLLITGLRIASFTYGILLSLFLLRLLNIKPKNLELIIASLCGILSVFIMQSQGVSWTWFVLGSTIITMSLSIILSPIFPADE